MHLFLVHLALVHLILVHLALVHLALVHLVHRSWQECGALCAAEPTCFFWSYVLPSGPSGGSCILGPDCDLCINDEPGFAISGKKGCVE